jgi:hypothetical protein
MWGSHSNAAEDPSFVGCDTVSGWVVAIVSKDINAFIVRVRQSQKKTRAEKYCMGTGDEGSFCL